MENKIKDWEKEFDKLNLGYDDSSIQCYFINGKGIDVVVKDFIKKTLNQQRTELLEEILKHNKDEMTGLYDFDGIALEVISLVKK